MDSIFKISKSGTYGIIIEGLEIDNAEYIPDAGVRNSIRNYMYSDSVTINTLSTLDSKGVETFLTYNVNIHNNAIDTTSHTLTKDGLYLISHIIIPNKQWFDYISSTYPADLENYSTIYYYDIDAGKFYKYESNVSSETTIGQILTAQYDWSGSLLDKPTTVIRADKNTFIMYYLNECFAKVCKNLLTNLSTANCKSKEEYTKGIFTRDLLWMAINVIKYNIEILQLYEAQRVLENINFCSSTCTNIDFNTYGNGCGCNS